MRRYLRLALMDFGLPVVVLLAMAFLRAQAGPIDVDPFPPLAEDGTCTSNRHCNVTAYRSCQLSMCDRGDCTYAASAIGNDTLLQCPRNTVATIVGADSGDYQDFPSAIQGFRVGGKGCYAVLGDEIGNPIEPGLLDNNRANGTAKCKLITAPFGEGLYDIQRSSFPIGINSTAHPLFDKVNKVQVVCGDAGLETEEQAILHNEVKSRSCDFSTSAEVALQELLRVLGGAVGGLLGQCSVGYNVCAHCCDRDSDCRCDSSCAAGHTCTTPKGRTLYVGGNVCTGGKCECYSSCPPLYDYKSSKSVRWSNGKNMCCSDNFDDCCEASVQGFIGICIGLAVLFSCLGYLFFLQKRRRRFQRQQNVPEFGMATFNSAPRAPIPVTQAVISPAGGGTSGAVAQGIPINQFAEVQGRPVQGVVPPFEPGSFAAAQFIPDSGYQPASCEEASSCH